MPFTQPQPRTSGKRRRGGIGARVVLVLALVLLARAGGPAGAAHLLLQLADDVLEVAHIIVILATVAAVLALIFRVVRICWADRHVHVITDAAWPRGTSRADWTEAA